MSTNERFPQKKVLIVDDDPVSRKVLAGLFRGHDVTIETAEDGWEAVDAFRGALFDDAPYQLVCLDYYLPVMDGKAALKMMRDIEEGAGIATEQRTPVVMVSSEHDEAHIVDVLNESGASDYITKPYERRRIDNIIQRYIYGQKNIDGIWDDYVQARERRENKKTLKDMCSRFLKKRHDEDNA